MPHISQLKQSRFLTRADVGSGVLATIKNVYQDNVAKEGAPEELRWCIEFVDLEKPMVLNSTNGQIIAAFSGKDDTDHWAGVKVVLYDDPNVSFGGKLVGGIRCRAPRNQPKPVAPKAATRPEPGPAAEQPGRVAGEDDPNVPF